MTISTTFAQTSRMSYFDALKIICGYGDKRAKEWSFGSESVSPGHPDKLCDYISDLILDMLVSHDPDAHVACETAAMNQSIIVGGEITTTYKYTEDEIKECIFKGLKDIGYVDGTYSAETIDIRNLIIQQSREIAAGVTANKAEGKETGAGDQGIMFGYACRETEALMPAPIYYAHLLMRKLFERRMAAKSNDGAYGSFMPDAKSQIIFKYKNGKPYKIENIVISTQHKSTMSLDDVRKLLKEFIQDVIPSKYLDENTKYELNTAGTFITGGPEGDAGLTGRKIIVDTYGGSAPHGGGAFSGKDATKVDRTAAYATRYIAKNIVEAGLAERCTVQVTYAIGKSEPLSVYIDTHGTAKVHEDNISQAVKESMSLTPDSLINRFNMKHPIYAKASAFGHFGREAKDGFFGWEKIDLAATLREKALDLENKRKAKALRTVTFGLFGSK